MSDVGLSNSVAYGLLAILIAIPIAAFIGAFLIGSIPFGYLIGRFFFHTDIRAHGSGNIGAMNALRTLGKGGAIVVLLLDALKGFVPTAWALIFFEVTSTSRTFLQPSRSSRRSSPQARCSATASRHGCVSEEGKASRRPLARSLRSRGRRVWSRSQAGSWVPR